MKQRFCLKMGRRATAPSSPTVGRHKIIGQTTYLGLEIGVLVIGIDGDTCLGSKPERREAVAVLAAGER